MTVTIGLTGSIGMGKSTTAQLFADAGCAVWDADAAVHRIYAAGGAAVPALTEFFPSAIVDGAVSRDRLKDLIAEDPAALPRIESIVHPLVGQDRALFVERTKSDIIVFDIPLLFETGGDTRVDYTVVVTAPPDVQQARVMARGTMSMAQFDQIRAKQMPDAEKRAQADFVVVTDTIEHAAAQVQDIVRQIRDRQANA